MEGGALLVLRDDECVATRSAFVDHSLRIMISECSGYCWAYAWRSFFRLWLRFGAHPSEDILRFSKAPNFWNVDLPVTSSSTDFAGD
jgi:hypothetical protein